MAMSEQTISRKALRRRQSRDLSVASTGRRMLEIMSPSERRRLWLLTPVITVNALMQVVGIASVMPFLSLIANPDVIREQWLLAWLYDTLGFEDTLTFTIFAGVGVLALLVLSNAFAAVSQYLMVRFSWGVNHTMSVRMLRTYLFKPYVFFLDQNTAGLAKNILGEVKHAVKHFVVAGMNLVARGVVAASSSCCSSSSTRCWPSRRSPSSASPTAACTCWSSVAWSRAVSSAAEADRQRYKAAVRGARRRQGDQAARQGAALPATLRAPVEALCPDDGASAGRVDASALRIRDHRLRRDARDRPLPARRRERASRVCCRRSACTRSHLSAAPGAPRHLQSMTELRFALASVEHPPPRPRADGHRAPVTRPATTSSRCRFARRSSCAT
jgi:hypothetical protein